MNDMKELKIVLTMIGLLSLLNCIIVLNISESINNLHKQTVFQSHCIEILTHKIMGNTFHFEESKLNAFEKIKIGEKI